MRGLVLATALLTTGVAVPDGAATTARPCTQADFDAMQRPGSDAPPPGFADCVGVLPGMRVFTTSLDGQPMSCVTGVVFRGGDGRAYMAAPGRCLLKPRQECVTDTLPLAFPLPVDIPVCITLDPPYNDEEAVYPRGRGVPVRDGNGTRLGEWAYAIYQPDMDFGLIRIDQNITFSPKVCYWGGPTGMETGVRTTPEQLLVASTDMATYGVAGRGLYDISYVDFTLDEPDNGAVVLTTDGKAVGGLDAVFYLGGRRILRYPLGVDRARTKLRIGLTLLTAPLVP